MKTKYLLIIMMIASLPLALTGESRYAVAMTPKPLEGKVSKNFKSCFYPNHVRSYDLYGKKTIKIITSDNKAILLKLGEGCQNFEAGKRLSIVVLNTSKPVCNAYEAEIHYPHESNIEKCPIISVKLLEKDEPPMPRHLTPPRVR